MTKEEKIKLLQYFFPTENIREFMCNDFFIELSKLLPYGTCINSYNIVNYVRIKNLNFAQQQLQIFLETNKGYINQIENLYGFIDYKFLLTAYVFYLSTTKRNSIDLFKNKKSICFTIVSILDILKI